MERTRMATIASQLAFVVALVIASSPALARNPFGNRGSEPVPGHDVRNQAPEAPAAALTWDELMNLEVTVENPAPLQTVFHVSYPESLKAKDGTVVRIEGLHVPPEAGETHTYFLLSALPPNCTCWREARSAGSLPMPVLSASPRARGGSSR